MRIFLLVMLSGFLVGDLVNVDLNIIWQVLAIIILSLIIVAVFFRENLIIIIVVSVIGFMIGAVYSNFRNAVFVPPKEAIKQTEIVGVIHERPALSDRQQLVLWVDDQYKVLVNVGRYPEYHYGQKLQITGTIEEPVVFPEFNYKNYLKGKQIYLVMNRVDKIEDVGFEGTKYKEILYNLANKFEASLNRSLPEPEASFAAGLLLGSRRNLPDSLNESMQITGTSHLVAISGYNITIIAGVLVILLFSLGRRTSFLLVLASIFAFVVLTGASASVVRGALVSILALFGKVMERRADQTNLLLLAAILILLFNPLMLLYDMGFLLSFAAFAGLIYLGPTLIGLFERSRLTQKSPEIIRGTLAETLGAQVFTLPILLFAFGRFSLIAPIPNILILPLVPLSMLLSFIVGIFGLISPALGNISGYVAWLFLFYPLKVIELFSKIPLASYNLKQGNLALAVILYIIITLVTLRFIKKYKNVKSH